MSLFHPHADINQETEPGCDFMREMLSGLADGTAHGMTRWYAETHVAGCPHCAAALAGLRTLRARLQAAGVPVSINDETAGAMRRLSPDRQAALVAAWRDAEKAEA